MNLIKSIIVISAIAICSTLKAQTPEQQEISNLLTNFLDSVSYPQMHQKFWAEDLIYTSSAGKRFGKEAIVKDITPPTKEELASAPTYSSENVNIRIFDGTGVLTFTLISNSDGKVAKYLNSGTLIKRNGRWQVICWQATKMSE